MKEKPFDPTKPVMTRDGRAVRILCTDLKDTMFPLVVAITNYDGGQEHIFYRRPDGSAGECPGVSGDLVNIPPPPPDPVEVLRQIDAYWLNSYADGPEGDAATSLLTDKWLALWRDARAVIKAVNGRS